MTTQTLPITDVSSEPFWSGASQRKLLVQRCPATGRYQWYPRGHSIHAPEAAPEWVEASGRGTVFSFTTIHRGNGPATEPYTCGLIMLDEGIMVLSHIVGVPEADLAVGMPVQVTFRAISSEVTLPVFERLAEVP